MIKAKFSVWASLAFSEYNNTGIDLNKKTTLKVYITYFVLVSGGSHGHMGLRSCCARLQLWVWCPSVVLILLRELHSGPGQPAPPAAPAWGPPLHHWGGGTGGWPQAVRFTPDFVSLLKAFFIHRNTTHHQSHMCIIRVDTKKSDIITVCLIFWKFSVVLTCVGNNSDECTILSLSIHDW